MLGKSIYSLLIKFLLCLLMPFYSVAQQAKEDSTKKSSDFLTSEVHYFATDSSNIDFEEKKVMLYHQAKVNYEEIELQAEYIIINWDDNTIYAIVNNNIYCIMHNNLFCFIHNTIYCIIYDNMYGIIYLL